MQNPGRDSPRVLKGIGLKSLALSFDPPWLHSKYSTKLKEMQVDEGVVTNFIR